RGVRGLEHAPGRRAILHYERDRPCGVVVLAAGSVEGALHGAEQMVRSPPLPFEGIERLHRWLEGVVSPLRVGIRKVRTHLGTFGDQEIERAQDVVRPRPRYAGS